jgi:uncharacterized protein (TIGR02099 family)
MRNIIRIIVKRFWGLCAFLLIGLAVVVTIGRELAPQVSHYRSDIEAYLSQRMDVQVRLGGVGLNWEGLSPELRLDGLQITSPDGDAILSVDRGIAEVDLLRTLFNWQLALGHLEFGGVMMGFEQSPEGNWSLRGLAPWSSRDEQIDFNDPLDIFLLGHHIEIRDASFSFDFRTGHSSHVQLPHLVLENSGNFHRLRSEVAVDRNRDVLSLVVEAHGDPRRPDSFRASGYVRLQQFELDKAVAALPGRWWDGLPNQEWRKGHLLNLEAWLDISEGMAVATRGWLDIGELPLAFDQAVATPRRTTANFAGRLMGSGAWQLSLNDIRLEWDELRAPETDLLLSSAGPGQPVSVQTGRLDLAAWTQVARRADLLTGKARAALDALNPAGALENVKVSIAGTRLNDLSLRANLRDVAIDSWHGAPALERVSGYVEGSPLRGHADVASHAGFSMHYPTILKEPLAFDRATGRVHWQIDLEERTVKLHSGLISVSSEVGEGRGYFTLDLPIEFGSKPEELVVQVGLRGSKAQYHRQFVPYVLPESLIAWLHQSVGEGEVSSGGFLYRGGFSAGSIEHAAIQLFLDVENADLAYHPDWPSLRETDGVVWLDDRRILATVDKARLLDTEVAQGSLLVEALDGGELQLQIAGRARGDAGDGLRLIRETPLANVVDPELFADWSVSGEMQTRLDMTLPLASGQPIFEHLDMAFSSARLSAAQLGLDISEVQGQVSYRNGEGLRSNGLAGVLWGNPVQASLVPNADSVAVTLDGRASIDKLQEWSGRPELAFLHGDAAVTARLKIPFGTATRVVPTLEIDSDLQGVAIDLPQPFGKHSDESRPLSFRLPLAREALHAEFSYDDQVRGQMEFSSGHLLRAGVGLGGVAASLPAQGGLSVQGRLSNIELTEWRATLDRYLALGAADDVLGGPNADWARIFDLEIDRFAYGELVATDLKLSGTGTAGRWRIAMDSHMVAGEAVLYQDKRQPLLLELEHLRLPEPEPEMPDYLKPFLVEPDRQSGDLLAQMDPRRLPAINFAVREFSVGEDNFGTWSFQLRPTQTGVVLSQVIGSVRGGQLIGQQLGQGAELHWENIDGQVRSRFAGRFVTANLGSVLQQWNQPHLLDSESSLFDAQLSWTGSPAAISLTSLRGDISMGIKRGTFIRGAGEASTGSALLELLAFFNFDTWLRRLRLDFSDLNRAGTAFETLEGVLRFDQGKVYMDTPVVVNSNSSRFQMAGAVDLVKSELDTKLVATIPVGGNLTFVAALTGMGLPAVAGMWLISKVFEEQIGKMSSLSFHVTGPLDDPEMDFVRLFDDKVVQKEVSTKVE